jgi:hypothetical protein
MYLFYQLIDITTSTKVASQDQIMLEDTVVCAFIW